MTDRAVTYRVQDGCHNCAMVFVRHEYDCWPQFFCALNAPPRPACGSVAMDDYDVPSGRFWGGPEGAGAAWDKWSEGREVDPAGICAAHERNDDA